MNRGDLDHLTLEQLRDEARRRRVTVVGDQRRLIDAIAESMERSAPISNSTDGGGGAEGRRATEGRTATAADEDAPVTASMMQQVLSAVTEDVLRHQRELQNQQFEFLQRQQEQFALLTQTIIGAQRSSMGTQAVPNRMTDTGPSASAVSLSSREVSTESAGTSSTPQRNRIPNPGTPGGGIKWLATQIPEFGGGDEENVAAWVRRVEKVAEIHGATDGVTLLAASSRLVRAAKRWYDIQAGPAMETWSNLRRELTRIFDRKVPFYRAMQRVEARTWRTGKESFDDYAIEKLALIHQLELPVKDTINLLTGGIQHPTLRATALSLDSSSVEDYLDSMRHITAGVADLERRRPFQGIAAQQTKTPQGSCRNCGKSGHIHQLCRAEPTCFYCKKPGHRQTECPAKQGGTACFYCKKPGHRQYECPAKQGSTASTMGAKVYPKTPSVAAAVTSADEATASEDVAVAMESGVTLKIGSPLVTISTFCNQNCKLVALVDTGSPVSFVKNTVYTRFCKGYKYKLKPSSRNLRNLCNKPLDLEGIVNVELEISELPKLSFETELFVISNAMLEADVILGREFLQEQKLTLVYKPADKQAVLETNLFTVLPLHVSEDTENIIEEIITNSHIDFNRTFDSYCPSHSRVRPRCTKAYSHV